MMRNNLASVTTPQSGTVTSLERKREVYRIAQQYDLLVIEDDPYYMLQYRGGMFSPPPSKIECSVLRV